MATIGALLATRLAQSQQDGLNAEVYRRLNPESEEYKSTCERLSNEIKTIESDPDYNGYLADEAAKAKAEAAELTASQQVQRDMQDRIDSLTAQVASLEAAAAPQPAA